MLCNQWQGAPLCSACLDRWRGSASRCSRCAATLRLDAPDDVCRECEDQSPEFDRAIAALSYEAPWTAIVSRLKFKEATAISRPLADLLYDAISLRPHAVDLIIPVPLSSERLKERGYNQSWLLAQHLAARLQIPAHHDVLKRRRHTARLMSLDAEERRAHIANAFEIRACKIPEVQNRRIAVVDDVLTTGATLNEVAMTLRDAGARSISAWVLARTPAPDSRRRSGADAMLI